MKRDRMSLLRELSRRKLRTALTIVGMTIGIWALVVFSSMAIKINGLVGMGSEFYADKIVVTDGEAFGTSPMPAIYEADSGLRRLRSSRTGA
jgi:ABC-type antimicrobial peptide transport system permease subunit